MSYEIPTEAFFPFLDQTIAIHWDNHAYLMFFLWFILAPIAILHIRFGKPKPTVYGIEPGTSQLDKKLLWWTVHFTLFYGVITISIAGALLSILLSGGFSGTLHAYFGIGTVLLGTLQILSAWLRGSHGGKQGIHSDPNDPLTWGGDHFDMTSQRWWFEAYHKTAGYFALVLAIGAVATGLSQYWIASFAIALFPIFIIVLVLAIYLQGRGRHYDTYRSVYGTDPDHPFNKARKGL